MKLIIAGTRDLDLVDGLVKQLVRQFQLCPTEVVSGASGIDEDDDRPPGVNYANGVDGWGELYANLLGIKIRRFRAKFKTLGRPAGPIRNKEMAIYADELLLIWDGKSKGSHSMRHEMYKLGKPVHEIILRSWNEKAKVA